MFDLIPREVSKTPFIPFHPKCGACGLDKTCLSPRMPVSGEGRKEILVLAEAPGEEEDRQNTQLVGRTGQYLRRVLLTYGIDLDKDCWKTNALICRPPENRTPTDLEIDHCRPNLKNTIDRLKPRMILTFGLPAVQSLLAPWWRENVGSMSRWAGWHIPFQPLNSWVVPNYHPSYVAHTEKDQKGPVVKVWFERYLERAATLAGRPWDAVPDYEKQVKVILDPNVAAAWIRERLTRTGAFTFDYETNCLKPDSSDAEIVCCSVCWAGKETIAYPWAGEAIIATGELARSPHPKIMANGKFEDRWTRRAFGHPVENIVWDVILKAHIDDNRDDITSVKYQAFVLLGYPDWSDEIKSFLKAKGGNEKNRIREVDLRTLLMYCGIDSLVEFEIAIKQRSKMRCKI